MNWYLAIVLALLGVAIFAIGITVGADTRRNDNDLLEAAEANLTRSNVRALFGGVALACAISLMFYLGV